MILLHAAFRDRGFLLWAEAPPDGEVRAVRRPGRRPKVPRSAPLPYGAGAAELCRTVNGAVPDLGLHPDQAAAQVAWLPSADGMPLPSSPLIADPPETAKPLTLAPWTVSALVLRPAQVLDLLCACAGRNTLAPGLLIAPDLAYWAHAMRLAGSLAVRQRFLPGVAGDETGRGLAGGAGG